MSQLKHSSVVVFLWFSVTFAVAAEESSLPFARIFASTNGQHALRLVVGRQGLRLSTRASLIQPFGTGDERVVWERYLDYIPDRVLVSDRGDVIGVDQAMLAGHWNSIVVFDRTGSVIGAYELDDLLPEVEIEEKIPLRDGGRHWRELASFTFDYQAERGGKDAFMVSFDWGRQIAFDLRTGRMLDEDAIHPETVSGWPRHLAGRELQFITEHYVLYGTDRHTAKAMRKWLDIEITNFERQHDMVDGRGLVLMLESYQAPLPEIDGWHGENPDRSRVIRWTSDGRRQETVNSRTGRPYCYFQEPYFRESYVLSCVSSPGSIGSGDSTVTPTWVCALSTDDQVMDAFNDKAREHEHKAIEKAKKEMKGMPADQHSVQWMFYGAYKLFSVKWRSIDIKLMRLERREALWEALIRNSEIPDEQQTRILTSLRDEIDEAWKKSYFSRPYD